MKKSALLILFAATLLVLHGYDAWAQIDGAANATKQGSLLVFPKVVTTKPYETYIIINNNSANDVHLKCFWEIKDDRTKATSQSLVSDFTIHLVANAPVVFRASDGSSLDNRGVAAGRVSFTDNTAEGVTAAPTTAWQYNAWRFATNVIASDGTFADGFWVGAIMGVSSDDYNTLNLKASPTTIVSLANCVGPDYADSGCSLPNGAYDACPKYISFEFLSEPSSTTLTNGYAFNNLAVAPCKSDFTDLTSNSKTTLKYTIWNEREVKVADLYQCANSAYSRNLNGLIVGRSLMVFQNKFLRTPVGLFRVEGIASTACTDSAYAPLLGVMCSKIVGGTAMIGSTGSTNGKETSDWGYIKWTPTGGYYQFKRP